MTWIAVVALVVSASVAVGLLVERLAAWQRTCVRKRVVVNLADQAFSGVLYARRGPLLVLRDAQLLTPAGPPQPVDGEVVIERSRVQFIQVGG